MLTLPFSVAEKGVFFGKCGEERLAMRFCVADVELELNIVNSSVVFADEEAEGAGVEEYLDNSFWQSGKSDAADYTIEVYPAEQLPAVGGEVIWEMETCTVRTSGGAEIRIYHDGVMRQPYAVLIDGERGMDGLCRVDWLRRYHRTNYLFNICALEKLLTLKRRMVFHSCYIEIGGKALLFSGFSGVGKSTQGALWEKYAGARVVNGDRAVLRKDWSGEEEPRWYACGFPFSGTSGICRNESRPLLGIIFLEQAEENHIRKVGTEEAGRLLWPQFTVNQWNPECVNIALEEINRISKEVPVYELCCTPDKRAVDCVKEALEI